MCIYTGGAAGWRRGAGGGFKYNPKGVRRRRGSSLVQTIIVVKRVSARTHAGHHERQQQMALGASENRARAAAGEHLGVGCAPTTPRSCTDFP